MSRSRAFVLFAFATLAAADLPAASFRIESSSPLPATFTIARDVRWADDANVYVSAGKEGIARVSVAAPERWTRVTTAAGAGLPTVGLLGATQKHVFAASQMGRSFSTVALNAEARNGSSTGLLAIMDVDARGDRAAVLGADAGPLQGLARDGVIVWTGSLSKEMKDMRPLMKGRSKPGGRDMARCSILETGAIRFMPDGSLVVMPGVEPGVYRYSAAGKLLQTWDTQPLGVVDDCAIEEQELLLAARDFGERIKWYAARAIVDDILPLQNGPALVIRRVENGVTKWDVVTLPYKGQSERLALPVTMDTPRAHVRGDVRGNRLVLLVWDDALPGQKPIAPPKLIKMVMEAR